MEPFRAIAGFSSHEIALFPVAPFPTVPFLAALFAIALFPVVLLIVALSVFVYRVARFIPRCGLFLMFDIKSNQTSQNLHELFTCFLDYTYVINK